MTPERASDIVHQLLGTCQDIRDFIADDEAEDDKVLLDAIDSEIFLCNECGWWCELSEAVEFEESSGRYGDEICQDCA